MIEQVGVDDVDAGQRTLGRSLPTCSGNAVRVIEDVIQTDAVDRPISHYLGYLDDRPDSIVAALRVWSRSCGAHRGRG